MDTTPYHEPRIPSAETRSKCRVILLETAVKYEVAPCLIVAHAVEPPAVNKARIEVQQRMFTELGMRRRWIAVSFGRSLRRVRKSVIGV